MCTLSTQHPLYNSALVAKARQERAAAGREERQWARQQLKEQEMQDEEQAAVRAANTLFDRHMTPLRHVFKTYSSYEEKLKRYSSPPHPNFFCVNPKKKVLFCVNPKKKHTHTHAITH